LIEILTPVANACIGECIAIKINPIAMASSLIASEGGGNELFELGQFKRGSVLKPTSVWGTARPVWLASND
jgi:hypothetical protein